MLKYVPLVHSGTPNSNMLTMLVPYLIVYWLGIPLGVSPFFLYYTTNDPRPEPRWLGKRTFNQYLGIKSNQPLIILLGTP
jgi:hypothetical protein